MEENKEDTRLAQRQLSREVLTDSWFEKLSLPRYSVHICRSQSMQYTWSSRGCLIFFNGYDFFFFFFSQTALILLALLPTLGPLPSGSQEVPGSGRSSICSCAYLAPYAILNGTHTGCWTEGMVVLLTFTTIGFTRHLRTRRWSNYCMLCSLIPTVKTCLAEINPTEVHLSGVGNPDTRQKRRSIVATSNKMTDTPAESGSGFISIVDAPCLILRVVDIIGQGRL
ncbi:hypothetical protein BDV41DRAFT_444144 [Aspergillus transmontanensis]|uniref:Uncharacterized protein n=1 Tax=Aspergillus transmontanensis TaxID=1034304 RepID=A0A5N6WBV8_9EURO|nr:hypothetical protein BDV41DRAFT_444144 [Aspergillus transmontanensis]